MIGFRLTRTQILRAVLMRFEKNWVKTVIYCWLLFGLIKNPPPSPMTLLETTKLKKKYQGLAGEK